jgi:hypothetical protein
MTAKNALRTKIIIPIGVLILLGTLLLIFYPGDKYHINRHIPANIQDTLRTNIVTYMGVKPARTDWQTRLEAQYRKFYIDQAKDFNIYKYFVDKNDTHFFYVIRPARHPQGNRRAIGGKMKVDENYSILEYEEIFVTQVLDETYLKEIADDLFMALINNNIESQLKNREIIEWPDGRLKYHRQKKEWRYDVDNDE